MTVKTKYQSAAVLIGAIALGFFFETPGLSQGKSPSGPTAIPLPVTAPVPAAPEAVAGKAGARGSSAATPASLGGHKVGTVDMSRVFTEYYKTREVERKLNEDKSKAKKEMDGRVGKYKELAARLAKIEKILADKLVNEQLKRQSRLEGQTLMKEANDEARGIEEFRIRRERQLQDQSDRMRKVLIAEIVDKLRDRAKRDNYDFVFDKSGMGFSGTLVMPVSRDAFDFSSEVIAELNRNAPAVAETGSSR